MNRKVQIVFTEWGKPRNRLFSNLMNFYCSKKEILTFPFFQTVTIGCARLVWISRLKSLTCFMNIHEVQKPEKAFFFYFLGIPNTHNKLWNQTSYYQHCPLFWSILLHLTHPSNGRSFNADGCGLGERGLSTKSTKNKVKRPEGPSTISQCREGLSINHQSMDIYSSNQIWFSKE